MSPRCLSWSTDLAVLVAGGSTVAPGDGGDGGEVIVRTPAEPTFWWGNFVLVPAVPADGTDVVERFGAALPGAAHVTVGFDDPAACAADAAWFAEHDFSIDRWAVLTAPALHDPGRRSGLACRPLRSAGDWDQHGALALRCRGAASGITTEFVLGRAATRRGLVERGAAQWWGAFAPGDRLVAQLGIVDVGEGRARYQSVETDPAWRRRGLATELLVLAAGAARDDFGASELVIVAEVDYWAVGLYRSLGFVDREVQLGATRTPALPA